MQGPGSKEGLFPRVPYTVLFLMYQYRGKMVGTVADRLEGVDFPRGIHLPLPFASRLSLSPLSSLLAQLLIHVVGYWLFLSLHHGLRSAAITTAHVDASIDCNSILSSHNSS